MYTYLVNLVFLHLYIKSIFQIDFTIMSSLRLGLHGRLVAV